MFILALIFSMLFGIAHADTFAAGNLPENIVLWPEGAKVLSSAVKPTGQDKISLENPENAITVPSMLVYQPAINSSRAAIIVFPGGGYKAVAVGKDSTLGENGSAVASWLNEAGITCVLLKYRVPFSGCYWDEKAKKHVTPPVLTALQDAQRAISTIRFNAKKYNLDPEKIGVMGFSAGGNLAVLCSTAFKKRSYEPIDAIDAVSCRPDFAMPVYPGHMTMEHKNMTPKKIAADLLNTDIVISPEIPPTLLVHAEDDDVDPVHYSLVYERELKKAGIRVKLNLYKTGGHAFGVKKSGKDTDRWTEDAISWLKENDILQPQPGRHE